MTELSGRNQLPAGFAIINPTVMYREKNISLKKLPAVIYELDLKHLITGEMTSLEKCNKDYNVTT